MRKTLVLVFAGLAAGFVIALALQLGAPPRSEPLHASDPGAPAITSAADGAATAARVAALEEALAAETSERAMLEQRIGELAAALDELRANGRTARATETPAEPGAEPAPGDLPRQRIRREAATLGQDVQRQQVERLVAAGFAPDRAEWINRRTQELRMEALQSQYEATREGRPFEPAVALAGERTLRGELGDADYERYLQALNRPTSVAVQSVLASSPAERVGLKPGDEIVAYDGKRVFDSRDLNALTLEGTAGESVVVEVKRDGLSVQLVLPRGPLGITGGFRGPPLR